MMVELKLNWGKGRDTNTLVKRIEPKLVQKYDFIQNVKIPSIAKSVSLPSYQTQTFQQEIRLTSLQMAKVENMSI